MRLFCAFAGTWGQGVRCGVSKGGSSLVQDVEEWSVDESVEQKNHDLPPDVSQEMQNGNHTPDNHSLQASSSYTAYII